MTELCDLALKYGTDKAIYYTPFYHELFKHRRDITKVLELGIGHPETMLSSVCRMGRTEYTPGASLFMWRDYFPKADIYALDNRRDIFINEERIKSFYVDQDDPSSFDVAIDEMRSNFDLIVEDGKHTYEAQLLSATKLLPHLKLRGTYIVEDVGNWGQSLMDKLQLYDCELKDFGEARVIVVRP